MEDVNSWQTKFEPCQYSDRLINKLLLLNTKTTTPVDIQEVNKAIYYAKKYHGDQKRFSGEPYYTHPIEVAFMVADYIFRTDAIVTAILHDTIEDTTMTAGVILDLFGRVVAGQVDDLTRIKFNKKITAGETVNFLFTRYKKDVLYVKLFDRLHNVQTIHSIKAEKAKKIIDETVVHFIPLASYLGLYEVKQELTRLCHTPLLSRQPACKCQQNQAIFCWRHSLFSPIFQSMIDQIRSL
jgi:(p)ppGpp synthase/HD superfamily hydrolase